MILLYEDEVSLTSEELFSILKSNRLSWSDKRQIKLTASLIAITELVPVINIVITTAIITKMINGEKDGKQ